MLNVNISYPVSHFNDHAITIPDKYTLSGIIGSILGMNGGVIFDNIKFSTKRYIQQTTDRHVVGRITLNIGKKMKDGKWQIIYFTTAEDLSTLEMIIYKIMQKIDRFPDRDSRYDVDILDVEI